MTPNAFLDLGGRNTIDKILSRLVAKGTVRRLARGIFDYPETDPILGPLLPSPQKIGQALSKQYGVTLQPSGAYAANLLGLSEQVPAKIVFLTDGPSRLVKIGTMEIQLRHAEPRMMATAGKLSGLIIQALRYLGKEHVTPDHVTHFIRTLPAPERERLIKDLRFAPAWMHPILREISQGNKTHVA